MYSRISRRKIIKKNAQIKGKTQINALSPLELCPLRPLHEIKITPIFSRKGRKERRIFISILFHACAGGSQTSL